MLLDLNANQSYATLVAPTITNVVQNGMAGTKCVITFNTNAAYEPNWATVPITYTFEFSTDGGATWPTSEGYTGFIQMDGVSRTVTFTTAAVNYSTNVKVRAKYYSIDYGDYSAYSAIYTGLWDYFPPATVFPGWTISSLGGGIERMSFTGTPPALNVPNKRFRFIIDSGLGYTFLYDTSVDWPANLWPDTPDFIDYTGTFDSAAGYTCF